MHHPGAHQTSRRHPVRGIGWIGYIALALFLTLAIGEILAPRGLRYELLRFIAERTPSQSQLANLVASAITMVGLNTYIYISFGVLALLYLLPAFWIAPRERTVVRFVLIPLWCLFESLVLYSPWSWDLAWQTKGALGFAHYEYIPVAIAVLGHAVLLWAATGRVWIAVTLLALTAAGIVWAVKAPWYTVRVDFGILHSVTAQEIVFRNVMFTEIGWHLFYLHCVMAFVMIHWALRERRRASSTTACLSCGYSLYGLTATVCPECGTSTPSLVGGVSEGILYSAPSPVHERSE